MEPQPIAYTNDLDVLSLLFSLAAYGVEGINISQSDAVHIGTHLGNDGMIYALEAHKHIPRLFFRRTWGNTETDPLHLAHVPSLDDHAAVASTEGSAEAESIISAGGRRATVEEDARSSPYPATWLGTVSMESARGRGMRDGG
ncbi:hypothetical protein BN946_scf185016.g102, partial [Trametes cinnabarina]